MQPTSSLPTRGLHLPCSVVAALTAFGLTIGARAGDQPPVYRIVALSGQQAPGLDPGTTLLDLFPETSLITVPRIDNNGRVIAHIFLGGAGVSAANSRSIWAETGPDDALELLARQGSAAPGAPAGVLFIGFPSPLNPTTPPLNQGRTTFVGSLQGPGIVLGQTTNAFGVWSSGAGPLTMIARSGDPAPGLPAGTVLGSTVSNPFTGGIINASGAIIEGVFLGGPGVTAANDESLWSDRSGSFTLLLREGESAPGTSAVFGASPESFSPGGLRSFAWNDASRFALYGNLSGEGVDFLNDDGIWVETDRGLQLIAREGEPAPDTPWTFGEGGVSDTFNSLRFNNDGKVAFRAGLGAGSMVSGNATLWSDRSGALAMIVGPGIDQPGVPSGSVTGVFAYSLTNTNRVGFVVGLLMPGEIFSTDAGIWSDRNGAMVLVAKTGDPAPGTDKGVVFDRFIVGDGRDFFRQTDHGDIAFRAQLEGPGVSSLNDLAYYLSSPDGEIHLMLRKDQLLDVGGDGDDVRIVSDILPGGVNEHGEWAFKVLFTDGSIALVTAKLTDDIATADLDGDGDVDGLDLASLLAAWGACPKTGSCAADLNDDGVVNGFDLAMLLAEWG